MNTSAPTPPSSSKHPSRVPWLILLIAIIAAAAPFLLVQGKEDIIEWRAGYDVQLVIDEARRENKPVLLYFGADWCGPCKTMRRMTFSEAKVKQFVEARFVPMRLDMTHKNEKTQAVGFAYRLQYLPTYIVLSPDGKELKRDSAPMEPDAFIAWLSAALDDAAATPKPDGEAPRAVGITGVK